MIIKCCHQNALQMLVFLVLLITVNSVVDARLKPITPIGDPHSALCYHQMPGQRSWVKMHCAGINISCFVTTNCTNCNDPNYNDKMFDLRGCLSDEEQMKHVSYFTCAQSRYCKGNLCNGAIPLMHNGVTAMLLEFTVLMLTIGLMQ